MSKTTLKTITVSGEKIRLSYDSKERYFLVEYLGEYYWFASRVKAAEHIGRCILSALQDAPNAHHSLTD